MKRNLLILAWVFFGVFGLSSFAMAQCNPGDNGVCDTLYVEAYLPDQQFQPPPPHFVRFPIYVTHDVPDPYRDSLAGFIIILDYYHSNPSKYCSLSTYWNNTSVYPWPNLDRSIFRNLPNPSPPPDSIPNRMMQMSYDLVSAWSTIILDLTSAPDYHFWLSMVPTGTKNQRWWEGSRVLLVTMTFKLEDSTTICVDTCFWPPSCRFAFSRSDAVTYIPIFFLPVCETLGFGPPPWVGCPDDQHHHTNGQFTATGFSADSYFRVIQSVNAEFVGDGVENVWLDNVTGLGTSYVQGDVVYDVTDHCGPGGTITITVMDDAGQTGECNFYVILSNDLPDLNLPDTWRALAEHSMRLEIYADDPDNDSVVTVMNAFWHDPDSSQLPTNYPTFHFGNPGIFTWLATEADTGIWISSFSAIDVCGAIDTHQVDIQVGMPFCGDCTKDAVIDLGDVVYLINYLFKGGAPPDPLCQGDANCNGDRDIGDVVLLINFLYKGGFAPCFECCAGISAGAFTKPDSPN